MKTKTISLFSILIGCGWLLLNRFAHKAALFGRITAALANWSWVFWTILLFGVVLLIRERWGTLIPRPSQDSDSRWIEAGILLLTALSLSMLIHSGYYWDDAVNSVNYLAEKYNGKSVWENVLHFMSLYLKLGRINVLSFYYYFFFYIENVAVYKALTIALILLDQHVFEMTLLETGLSRRTARIGMLLIPALIQVRMYQDPVSGFYGLLQVLTAEMLLTVLFLLRYRKSGKCAHLVLSLIPFALGLLTYEVCFPFIAMVVLLNLAWELRSDKAFFRSLLRALRTSLPYLVIVILLLAAVIFIRSTGVKETDYSGVAFSLKPSAILQTAWHQLSAALPLSFYTAGHWQTVFGPSYAASDLMAYTPAAALGKLSASDIALLCFALLLLWANRKNGPDEGCDLLIVSGLSFWVLPILTVALSQRYQGQLYPGLGYLPVYMEYFGIAMLLTALLTRSSRVTSTAVCCAFCVIFLLGQQNNRSVTEVMNRYFYDPRNAGEAALRGGILDFLPDDALLAVCNTGDYLWEADWANHGLYREFYSIYSGKSVENVVRIEDVPESAADVRLIAYGGTSQYGLTRFAHRTEEGCADQVLYFVSGSYPEHAVISYTEAGGALQRIGSAEGQVIRKTDHGILYRLDPSVDIIFDSLQIMEYK